MGGTTSKESSSGGSESRGGVQHVTTNTMLSLNAGTARKATEAL